MTAHGSVRPEDLRVGDVIDVTFTQRDGDDVDVFGDVFLVVEATNDPYTFLLRRKAHGGSWSPVLQLEDLLRRDVNCIRHVAMAVQR